MHKILLDENLPSSLERIIEGSIHVERLGLAGKGDSEIWTYAQEHELIIATKDSDYLDFVTLSLQGRVLFFNTGNLRLKQLKAFVECSTLVIAEFAGSTDRVLFLSDHSKSENR